MKIWAQCAHCGNKLVNGVVISEHTGKGYCSLQHLVAEEGKEGLPLSKKSIG